MKTRTVRILVMCAAVTAAMTVPATSASGAAPSTAPTPTVSPASNSAADAHLAKSYQQLQAAGQPEAVAGAAVASPMVGPARVPGAIRVRTSSCAAAAAALAAGRIRSYNCATVKALPTPVTPSVTFPTSCGPGSGTIQPWVAVSRRAACDHSRFTIIITQKPSGTVVGTANWDTVDTAISSQAEPTIAATTELFQSFSSAAITRPQSVQGALFPNCPATTTASCAGVNGKWSTNYTDMDFHGTGSLAIHPRLGTAVSPVSGFWGVTMASAAWSNSVIVDYTGVATQRCDNQIGLIAGCVMGYIPIRALFYHLDNPQWVYHVSNALASGLPGRAGSSSLLTYLQSTTSRAANSSKACPRNLSAPSSAYDCDEYPFASTHQGASTSGATQARSFPGCDMPDPARTGPTGWSRCFILATQNRSAGSLLGGFYTSQRYREGDPFQVGFF